MKKIKSNLSNYLLAVMSVFLISVFLSCGGQNYTNENPVSPWELEWAINIGIEAGDDFVTLLDFSPVVMQKGNTWGSIKAEAEKKLSFISGYEFDSWRLEYPDGELLSDDYVFASHAKVFACSKIISTVDKITIFIQGYNEMKVAGEKVSLVINKNKTWSEIRNQAEGLIIPDAGFEIDKWMLGTPPNGHEIQDSYQFQDGDTIYAMSKHLSEERITIKIFGDSNITVADPPYIDEDKNVLWGKVKKLVEAKVSANPGYMLGKWYLAGPGGLELTNSYVFKDGCTVYVDSTPLPEDKAHLILTHDEHLSISNPKILLIERNVQWSSLKSEVENKVKPLADYRLKKWYVNDKNGAELDDSHQFTSPVNTIFAESEKMGTVPEPQLEFVSIKINIDSNEKLTVDGKAPSADIIQLIKLKGTTWNTAREDVQGRIKAKGGRLIIWSLTKGGKNLSSSYKFEKDTDVYVRAELPEGLYEPTDSNHPTLVTVEGAVIEGHDPQYPLTDTNKQYHFKGVFTEGRIITLTSYKIDKYEVTYKLWNTVRDWAHDNGYSNIYHGSKGLFGPERIEDQQPVTSLDWRDLIVWCNAYTEMTIGEEHCVYLTSKNGEILRNMKEVTNPYFDKTKKGYRLPTEAEWEFAARRQGFDGDSIDKTNAERYGGVYLTRADSASGAKKTLPFEGADRRGCSWAELKEEADRVAIYAQWWDGSKMYTASSYRTFESGTKAPNALGLFDMSGNVDEWCYDAWYNKDLEAVTETNPAFDENRSWSVIRGGSCSSPAFAISVCYREGHHITHSSNTTGFRLACNK